MTLEQVEKYIEVYEKSDVEGLMNMRGRYIVKEDYPSDPYERHDFIIDAQLLVLRSRIEKLEKYRDKLKEELEILESVI